MQIVYYIGAFVAGGLLIVQAALNGKVRMAIASPVWAAIISFVVGLVLLLGIAAARQEMPGTAAMRQLPWWVYIAGLLGASYVAGAAALVPRLGALTFFSLVVAGQMAASLLIDHYGCLGVVRAPITASRAVAGLLVLAAVYLAGRR